ncbi:MAG: hypothetical protein QM639_12480 [Rhodocyclaceae bacterium]
MSKPRLASDRGLATKADFFHGVIDAWLSDGDVTVSCGNWSDGVVSRSRPGPGAHLTPGRHERSLTGVRTLRAQSGASLLQLDLGRVHQACYAMALSIDAPSGLLLQIRFLISGPGGALTERWLLALEPAACDDPGPVRQFLARACDHWRLAPDCVGFDISRDVCESRAGQGLLTMLAAQLDRPLRDWADVAGALWPARLHERRAGAAPLCLPVLLDALRLHDASLVICRDRMVVEVPTDKVADVTASHASEQAGWRVGVAGEPHCYLALDAVVRVLFAAETGTPDHPQESYAVWFLTDNACGNPLRRDGYFSIRLNGSSAGDALQRKHAEALFDVYRGVMREPWVDADSAFLRAMRHGASTSAGRAGKPFARRVKKG